MVLDLIVKITDDGVQAEVPSLKGCESWAHTEEEAILKTIDLARFYLNLKNEQKIDVDLSRKNEEKKVYKLYFDT